MPSAIQASVTASPAAGSPGLEYDAGYSDVVTRRATTDIPFGRYVVFNAEGDCKLPATLAEITNNDGGVALSDNAKTTGLGYLINDPVRVLVRGRVWVQTEGTVAQSDPAFVRAIIATTEKQGEFRADAATAGAVAAPGVNFYIGVTGVGLAVVTVNHPKGT